MCGRDRAAAEFVSLYQEVIAEHKAGRAPDLDEEGLFAARHMRDLFLSTKNERESLQIENRQLSSDCDSLRFQMEEAERASQALAAQLSAQVSAKQTELSSVKNERDTLEGESRQLSAALSAKETELTRITSSLGWRLLSHYGRLKYRYLLPAYRILGLSRHVTVSTELAREADPLE